MIHSANHLDSYAAGLRESADSRTTGGLLLRRACTSCGEDTHVSRLVDGWCNHCRVVECALCGNPTRPDEPCQECGCKQPEHVETTPELLAAWIAQAEDTLSLYGERLPEDQRAYWQGLIAEWREQMRRVA